SPVDAEVAVRDTQLQDLAALAGQSLAISGALTATLKVQGTRKEPAGGGRIEIRRGALWGEPFDAFRAGVVFDQGEVRLSNAQVSKSKNAVTGSAAVHPERRTFRFDARGDNVGLADLQFPGKTGRKVEGSGSCEAAGSGRLAPSGDAIEQLALEGDLRLRKVSLDGRALGDLTATARSETGKLRVQIQSAFVGAELAGEGE